jgi:hypothetical protein
MSFSEEIIQKVWEKAKIAYNNDPDIYRKDVFNAWIKRDQYGMTRHEKSYGWTIDQMIPDHEGGTMDLSNLRPLQWENNKNKHMEKHWQIVTSEGVENRYEYFITSA